MTLPTDLVDAGTIMKTHGFRGVLRVQSNFGLEFLKEKEPVFIIIDNKPVPFFIESIRIVSDQEALIKLEDLDNKETAANLNGNQLSLEQSRLPKNLTLAGDTCPAIIGYQLLIDESKSNPGKITHITSQEDLLYLWVDTGSDEAVMTPFHPDLIVKIDHQKKTVLMNLPEGLFD